MRHDVIVIGLGAMGSAACFHLAKSGRRVLGLDQFSPPHTNGSSHGQTRIIREAYFEHPCYVPIVQRAYTLWAELEAESGCKLFQPTGGLMIGHSDGIVFQGAKRSAEKHALDHRLLTANDVRRQFPALNPDQNMAAVWEPRAGILFPELCVQTHLALARKHGATLSVNDPVLSWKAENGSIRVTTAHHQYEAGQLLISAGAWATRLLPELALPLRVERQVLYWFQPKSGLFHPRHCPIYLWEYEPDRFFYGFPDLGEGVKVARHHEGETVNPDSVPRTVTAAETEAMRQLVRRYLPDADGPLASATVCLYTDTPDTHFLIDFHPDHPEVLIASPCSGHGFKFSSAIGELLSKLLQTGHSPFDLTLFQLKRSPGTPHFSGR